MRSRCAESDSGSSDTNSPTNATRADTAATDSAEGSKVVTYSDVSSESTGNVTDANRSQLANAAYPTDFKLLGSSKDSSALQ